MVLYDAFVLQTGSFSLSGNKMDGDRQVLDWEELFIMNYVDARSLFSRVHRVSYLSQPVVVVNIHGRIQDTFSIIGLANLG